MFSTTQQGAQQSEFKFSTPVFAAGAAVGAVLRIVISAVKGHQKVVRTR